jgi:hypothetical protein
MDQALGPLFNQLSSDYLLQYIPANTNVTLEPGYYYVVCTGAPGNDGEDRFYFNETKFNKNLLDNLKDNYVYYSSNNTWKSYDSEYARSLSNDLYNFIFDFNNMNKCSYLFFFIDPYYMANFNSNEDEDDINTFKQYVIDNFDLLKVSVVKDTYFYVYDFETNHDNYSSNSYNHIIIFTSSQLYELGSNSYYSMKINTLKTFNLYNGLSFIQYMNKILESNFNNFITITKGGKGGKGEIKTSSFYLSTTQTFSYNSDTNTFNSFGCNVIANNGENGIDGGGGTYCDLIHLFCEDFLRISNNSSVDYISFFKLSNDNERRADGVDGKDGGLITVSKSTPASCSLYKIIKIKDA